MNIALTGSAGGGQYQGGLDTGLCALVACWQSPAGTAGMSMTLRFSFRSNGTLIGEPRVTNKVN
ncbi:hypothetical protein EDF68_1325 [Ochrobactrum sp. BH3]|nr:hypothetical protein EDF68_1325 [Ochrobactrum sp. BH3]